MDGGGGEEEVAGIPLGWLFDIIFIFGGGSYFITGIVLKRQRGGGGPGDWLPHHQFWSSLGGLVIDGFGAPPQHFRTRTLHPTQYCACVCPGLVLRGGTPASEYEKISSAVADMEKGGDSAGASVASLSAPAAEQPGQAVPGLPNALHSAATMGDATKLGKLLRALDASGSTPQLNSGDSRRYTVRLPHPLRCPFAQLESGNAVRSRSTLRAPAGMWSARSSSWTRAAVRPPCTRPHPDHRLDAERRWFARRHDAAE